MSEFDDLLGSSEPKKKSRRRRKAGVGELAVTGSAENMSGDPVRSPSDKKERPVPSPTPAGRSSLPGAAAAAAEPKRAAPGSRLPGEIAKEAAVALKKIAKGGNTCPRWMHHRKGEYCKTCGKTPTT